MRRPQNDMGRVEWIGAESVGVPGQRTFRLMAMTTESSAQLWLEKEQLQILAETIAKMLLEIDAEQGSGLRAISSGDSNPKPENFPARPEIEFQVGALGLRYDSELDLIALEAFEREAPDESAPEFRCLTTRQQMEVLQTNSLEVVSAGRPRCPLCGTPLPERGIPHFCPPTNGHQKLEEE